MTRLRPNHIFPGALFDLEPEDIRDRDILAITLMFEGEEDSEITYRSDPGTYLEITILPHKAVIHLRKDEETPRSGTLLQEYRLEHEGTLTHGILWLGGDDGPVEFTPFMQVRP